MREPKLKWDGYCFSNRMQFCLVAAKMELYYANCYPFWGVRLTCGSSANIMVIQCEGCVDCMLYSRVTCEEHHILIIRHTNSLCDICMSSRWQ